VDTIFSKMNPPHTRTHYLRSIFNYPPIQALVSEMVFLPGSTPKETRRKNFVPTLNKRILSYINDISLYQTFRVRFWRNLG